MEETTTAPKRRRFTPAAILAGVGGTLVIALTLGASLSGLVATITNTTNTAATAAMAIQETGPTGGPCNSYDATATCATINKYGGTTTPLVPGGSQTVTVAFHNTGTSAVSTSTLTPGTCTATAVSPAVPGASPVGAAGSATNLCTVMNIAVYSGTTATGTPLYNGSASGFTAAVALNPATLAVGGTNSFTFVTSLPNTAAANVVQGQQISQPLVWTFNS